MFYNNLKKICKENNTTVTSLSEELKLSSGNISKWKNGGTPKSETIIKIAQHFNISTDYLLDLDDVPNRKKQITASELTVAEKRLLSAFKELAHDEQMAEVGRVELLAEQAIKAKNAETA